MRKALTLMFVLLMLTSCAGRKRKSRTVDEEHDGKTYIALIESYQPRKKNVSNTVNDAKFEAFLDKVFVESMESDYMTMHFNVIDYKKYGIA